MEFLKRLIGRGATAQDTCLSSGQPASSNLPNRLSTCVMELARILDDERVAHVRGTPASGKTTLAYLLHEHYRQQNIPSVIISDWPQGNDHVHTDVLIRRAQDAGYTFVTADTLRNADIVYIIDEGQMSYHDSGLWLGFIKSQNNRRFGPRVCVFTSYGSPTGGPNDYSAGSPLAYLGVQQRVSITVSKIKDSPPISLFYNRNEFDDVLQRICTDSRRPLPLHPDAADYIFSLTNGHPGAVDSVLGMIQKVYRSEIKHGEIQVVEKDHIIATLNDEDESFRYLAQTGIQRSFVSRRKLTPQAAGVLREVLMNGSIHRDLDNEGIITCYENGWLHSEPLDFDAINIVCVFPTRLHAKYVEHYLTDSSVPFPMNQYPTVEALAEAVLRKFSLRNLSSTTRVGTGAVIRPVEAAYQDEFCRALHAVLGFSTKVSSEWSGDGNGRIDFRLADVGWGIELLREGNRLGAHCQRFVGNGSYMQWIRSGWLRDWLIIDCRTSPPHPYNVPGTKLWRAVFANDFSSVEVLDSSNRLLVPRFPLMS
ncbi:hypothetical protein T310_10216 [Rasamsonia emersonii CBS 393.64]|uniref:Uncharacterized protein n=1 Tax=Rasamsonia emersonii (strain ATCC 16479 / CBS 393.64 / IMI 116815) TaxID=1408163 RepID=A0A0F4YE59_RASE3|nr:hypothetical protein T310_10216 [Rasamsonia emersonii CBS 393.64]KKA16201.1 hypothetical protein T310_10216 [Rasamsonia emersonii CBS 393.64]